VPVRMGGSLPAAPPPGYPRDYRAWAHRGWQQVLIRDRDPSKPHDYFRGDVAATLVAEHGRWRLYRLPP
jgi:hypothetical protein